MKLKLSQVYSVVNPESYKMHLASWNGSHQPLDVFVRSWSEWEGWNRYRTARDDFSRDFIFSLIDFYPESDRWLFGGAFRVVSRKAVDYSASYKVELLAESQPYIGRLKISFKRPGRAKAVNFEKHYHKLEVSELLPASYTGSVFPGYDQIDITFSVLSEIVRRQREGWRVALQNVKGVYLITDIKNGKQYVGSAYGAEGIWSRWECYVGTGHGNSDELTKLISKRGMKYARKYFKLALLEHFSMKMDDEFVIRRESYWKNVLGTRVPDGYNKN